MSYSARMQKNQLYSVLLAPRGRVRMADAGAQIAQMYLSPFDLLIGIIGEAGSGKSMLIKGMFPGLELTNDDEGVNIRPLPIMDLDDTGFFSPHTYHLDVRFEQGFYQLHEIATQIKEALARGKRVIVEHFDLIYPLLGRNAHLLIGVGEELIVTRPTIFGPEPDKVAEIVFKSVIYRKMAHTAELLTEHCLSEYGTFRYDYGDVRHGFILTFKQDPEIDLAELEQKVKAIIEADLPVSFHDENHVTIGDMLLHCTGPRMQVDSTAEVEHFFLHHEFIRDSLTGDYMLVGIVGRPHANLSELNEIML